MGTAAEQTARPIPLCYSLCRPSGLVREVGRYGLFRSASLMSERTGVDGGRPRRVAQSSILRFIVFGEAIDGSGTTYDGNVGATPI